MNSPLTAGDIMSANIATTTSDTSLAAAVKLMLDRRVSGLPVLDEAGVLVGILTEGDLLRRVELGTDTHKANWLDFFRSEARLANDYVETHSRVVGDIMTPTVVTVDEAAPLSEVVAVMQGRHVKRVPVMAASRLVGMVSRVDLLRALARSFADAPSETTPDDAGIRAEILAEFGRQSWGPGGGISVVVSGGVVDLGGVIFREAQRGAMRVAAENVAGVTSVHDHMVWVEPNSGMTFAPDATAAVDGAHHS